MEGRRRQTTERVNHFRIRVIRTPILCIERENVIFLLTSTGRVQYYLSKEYCYLIHRQRGIILILKSSSRNKRLKLILS